MKGIFEIDAFAATAKAFEWIQVADYLTSIVIGQAWYDIWFWCQDVEGHIPYL